jgi:hypothetical protein
MNEDSKPTYQPQSNSAAEQPAAPITFSREQQAKIDLIVKASMGRAASETRQQLEAERQERARLDVELKAAQETLSATSVERDNEKNARLDAEQRIIAFRKQAFINEQCLDHSLIDAATVNALTEQHLEWDEAKQSFVVLNSEVTPAEFFASFAAQKPYLVRSDARTGPGSSASSRTGLSDGHQRYKVEEIFGPKSNSRFAHELMQRSPDEYRRLKQQAKAQRLI